ncbi:MAG TPA: hypothetical protein VFR07_11375 [Mycobacteriales bacterium]|jgi:hypothetical protein|nr:hypothetical protein [Mycobacteriales bacterium]
MFVVECPVLRERQVAAGGRQASARGQRLVSESAIRGFAAVPQGWRLTVACPCGQEHVVVWPADRDREARLAQVVG